MFIKLLECEEDENSNFKIYEMYVCNSYYSNLWRGIFRPDFSVKFSKFRNVATYCTISITCIVQK